MNYPVRWRLLRRKLRTIYDVDKRKTSTMLAHRSWEKQFKAVVVRLSVFGVLRRMQVIPPEEEVRVCFKLVTCTKCW